MRSIDVDFDPLKTSVDDIAAAFHLPREKAQELLDKLREIDRTPPAPTITVHVDQEALDDLLATLQRSKGNPFKFYVDAIVGVPKPAGGFKPPLIVPVGHAGGFVGRPPLTLRRFHAGGAVVGPGFYAGLAHDEIPVIARRGEFIVNASSAARIGPLVLPRLNRMHEGGLMGASTAASSVTGGDNVSVTVHMTINPAPGTDERALGRFAARAVEEYRRSRSGSV